MGKSIISQGRASAEKSESCLWRAWRFSASSVTVKWWKTLLQKQTSEPETCLLDGFPLLSHVMPSWMSKALYFADMSINSLPKRQIGSGVDKVYNCHDRVSGLFSLTTEFECSDVAVASAELRLPQTYCLTRSLWCQSCDKWKKQTNKQLLPQSELPVLWQPVWYRWMEKYLIDN